MGEKLIGRSSVETYIRISAALIRRSEGVGDVGGPADTSRIVATVRCAHLYRQKEEGKKDQREGMKVKEYVQGK